MVKDRLHELRAAQTDADNHVMIIDENISYCNQMQAFIQEVETIRQNIDNMSANVKEVKQIHSTILSSPTNAESLCPLYELSINLKKQLEDLMADTKRTTSKVRNKLKVIEMNISAMESSGSVGVDVRIKKVQHTMLLRLFIDVMNDYNRTQVDYREKCMDRIVRQSHITGRQLTNDQIEQMLESGNPTIFTQDIITDTQQAKQSVADIEARYADIIKLGNSIRELHDMFIDMELLIENQGETINRIETQVLTSKAYVDDGIRDIRIAQQYKAKARKEITIWLNLPQNPDVVYEISLKMSWEEYVVFIGSLLGLWFGFSYGQHYDHYNQCKPVLIISDTKDREGNG
ncbi:unnamed protein product [Medioppia subpectinata]|uniref:t-SNARE coiled-coil homology domain-containing protein n=1 Tax=Medioppia subpectinata TaxID=1979941 RepID=A0A7R9PXN4_9ACAR|nr:unnamed protein product [Medioppia subpectinata]CAG2105002.1 unnamed protein product [Medioppia subpectinata]